MEGITCPKCSAAIPSANQNVSTDLAQCPQCHNVEQLSSLINHKEQPQPHTPPEDTRVHILKERDAIALHLPASGVGGMAIFGAAFSLFWLGFVAVWTVLVLTVNLLFALFSIPFWIAGFAIAASVINSIFEQQKISFTSKSFILEKKRPIRPRRIEIPLREIRQFKNLLQYQQKSKGSSNSVQKLSPAVLTSTKTYHFFEKLSEPEQEWTVAFANALLQKKLAEEKRIHL